MRRLGLLGGMSWESSVEYERLINEAVRAAVGGGLPRPTCSCLLATRFTMEQDFYVGRLRERQGLDVLVPDEPDRTLVHDVIYDELVQGLLSPTSRAAYQAVVGRLVDRGAEGVIAGCTEIELLLGPADVPVPWFPTTRLHAEAAAAFALDR